MSPRIYRRMILLRPRGVPRKGQVRGRRSRPSQAGAEISAFERAAGETAVDHHAAACDTRYTRASAPPRIDQPISRLLQWLAVRTRILTALHQIKPTSTRAPPHGSLIPADTPLSDTEILFRQAGLLHLPLGDSVRPANPLISLVLPCYNEEENIPFIYNAIVEAFYSQTDLRFEVVFVNDGSRDKSQLLLDNIAESDRRVTVLQLSRNFGHQAAVSAGLAHAKGDAVLILDADMQDPPSVALEMARAWQKGADIVFAVRTARKEGLFKRAAYAMFYRMMRGMASIDVPLDSGDFGLIDRKALDVMLAMPEKNRFVRGLRAWVGFNQTGVVYERQARAHGESKYNFRRLLKLSADGIFNFSATPLRTISYLGIIVSAFTVFVATFIVIQRILDFSVFGVRSTDIPGFTSLALLNLLMFGVNFILIGVLGEYVGRIYEEVKARPTYVCRKVTLSEYN
jgi:polyisoprenyl-phosphate glycosyltransferase